MRDIVGGLFASIAAGLFLNVFGTADRMRLVSEVLWAWQPAIALGMAGAAVVALAPTILNGIRRGRRWFVHRRPSNRFLAEAANIQRLYREWTSYEQGLVRNPEWLVVLESDSMTLCEEYDIPCPGSHAPDGQWPLFLLNLIAASKRGDLTTARGLLHTIESHRTDIKPGEILRSGRLPYT